MFDVSEFLADRSGPNNLSLTIISLEAEGVKFARALACYRTVAERTVRLAVMNSKCVFGRMLLGERLTHHTD